MPLSDMGSVLFEKALEKAADVMRSIFPNFAFVVFVIEMKKEHPRVRYISNIENDDVIRIVGNIIEQIKTQEEQTMQ